MARMLYIYPLNQTLPPPSGGFFDSSFHDESLFQFQLRLNDKQLPFVAVHTVDDERQNPDFHSMHITFPPSLPT